MPTTPSCCRHLVEGLPGGKVFGAPGLGVGDEVVEAAPVLGDHDTAPLDGAAGGEEAEFGVGVELVAHTPGGGEPFARSEEAVDAQADEEDDQRTFDAGGVAAWVEGGHMGKGYTAT